MRSAPAVSVKAAVPAAARTIVALLGLAATVVALAWATAGELGLRLAVPMASFALTLHLLFELRAAPRRRVRWDGSRWWLRPEQGGAEEREGELNVACDLGEALLLHFVPAGARAIGGGVWLPLHRREIEGDWHALRCALYSPREPARTATSGGLDG